MNRKDSDDYIPRPEKGTFKPKTKGIKNKIKNGLACPQAIVLKI